MKLSSDERPPLPEKPDPFRRKQEPDNVRELQQFLNNVTANYFFSSTFKFFELDPNSE